MAEQVIKGVTLAGEAVAPITARLVTSDSFVPGSVLLCPTPAPRDFAHIMASAAILCTVGGRAGHLSSFCRARGIPVLLIEEGDLLHLPPGADVFVDPRHGTVAAITHEVTGLPPAARLGLPRADRP